ncbi:MAG: hypothetical protein U0836_04650 [Pirellulales bacterium]|jgi:hypothetical protein
MRPITAAELEAYLDEALPADRMAEIEHQLRADVALLDALRTTSGRRDAGVHSLGEIWRRHRLSCPSRDELGSFLLGVLPPEQERHLALHLETVGCRYCQSNLQDLRSRQAEAAEVSTARRKRYFQSSAGYLKQR